MVARIIVIIIFQTYAHLNIKFIYAYLHLVRNFQSSVLAHAKNVSSDSVIALKQQSMFAETELFESLFKIYHACTDLGVQEQEI